MISHFFTAPCKLSIYNFSDRAVGQTILLRQCVDGNAFSVNSFMVSMIAGYVISLAYKFCA